MALVKTHMMKYHAAWLAKLFAKGFSSTPRSDLRGGLALPRNKPGLSADREIKTLSLANTICIPLLNYQQEVLEPVVSIGQMVRPGDTLAPGIVASCHGVIESIEPHAVNHPSGMNSLCVVISPNTEKSNSVALHPTQEVVTAERISVCAIHGLGGAGFKTTEKLNAISATDHGLVDTLIINAVECEPLISCDESLIASHAPIIVTAIEGLIDLTQCRRCLFAIEDDKTAAIEQLEIAILDSLLLQ